MDYAIQRKNMVESQVRPSDVTDRRIIRAMLELPRERFVAPTLRPLAYIDGSVPLGRGRELMHVRTLAKLVQAADIEPGSVVLVVGAGTGYAAAVLARMAGRVVALEQDSSFADEARAALAEVDAQNVSVVEGDLLSGWASEGPYDAVLLEGAIETLPPTLLDQLKDGGHLVAVVKRGVTGRATVWRRNGRGFGSVEIFDATANLLPGFEKLPAFAF